MSTLLGLGDITKASESSDAVAAIREVCRHYVSKFLPTIRQILVDPPSVLRCGLARGTVYPVGNGQDFVGSCINMAARLQKRATFAFNRRRLRILRLRALRVFFRIKSSLNGCQSEG